MLKKLAILSVVTGCMLSISVAHAIVISKTNNTFGSVDGGFDTRTFDFAAGDFPGSSTVVGVTLLVDFSKCSVLVDFSGCPIGGGGFPFNDEIGFALTSPSATSVALVENVLGNELFEPGNTATFGVGSSDLSRIVMTFDDAGGALPSDPTDGTFAPEGSLAALIGENALGTWTFFFEDDFEFDPLGFHSATLNIEVADTVADIPEPATLTLFAAGLLGLGFVMWRRRRVR